MYYETNEGDEELRLLFLNTQVEQKDDEETSPKKIRQRKTRRSEENPIEQTSPTRPRRAAAIRAYENSPGQRRIDEFIAKKRSPIELILPQMSIEQGERCPVCDRIIPDDILDVHRQACEIQKSDTAKQIVKKIQERTKIEAKVKETLFPRTTRQTVITNQLTRNNSETSTCAKCGMQMTVHRLETQHKNECIADRRK